MQSFCGVLSLACVFIGGCADDISQKSDRAEVADPSIQSVEKSVGGSLLGWIVNPDQVTADRMAEWGKSDASVVLNLTSPADRTTLRNAAKSIEAAGLKLNYFIEIGRCPELAEQHPEWMASLQVHPEWRNQFPDVPQPTRRQVIKNYPWVTIMNRESFDAHVQRVAELLKGMPRAERLWLNDLQGAPSACGCGHPLCRWTADYGKVKTATPLGQDAAAEFLKKVRGISGVAEVTPIFVGECEAEDQETICCGVACFAGKCWKDFTKQLDLVAEQSSTVGVACFYKEFGRDLERYGEQAGWVDFTLRSFSEMPKIRDGKGLEADRLVAVLQGWSVSEEELNAQVVQAGKVGAAGWLVCLSPLDQSWQPVVFDLPATVPDNEAAAINGHAHQ